MRIPGRVFLTACALALTGCLAGCTSPHADAAPPKTPKPIPSTTPVFTSDADALAAATETYQAFLSASDAIGHDGGENPDRVDQYATPDVVEAERAQATKLKDARARSFGDTKISASSLQSVDQQGSDVIVTIYACEDLSDVDVRDDAGKSLIDPSRTDLVAYVVSVQGTSRGNLLVASNKFWYGGGVCGY